MAPFNFAEHSRVSSLLAAALDDGMLTLKMDGIEKVCRPHRYQDGQGGLYQVVPTYPFHLRRNAHEKAMLMFPAALLVLAGCAAQQAPTGDKVAAYEERYVPTGTMFATKNPKRTDATKMIDKDSLEQMIQQNGSINPNAKM